MRVFSPSVAKRVISRMPDWPARQLRPVVLRAGAERGHDAIAGHDDDRTSMACHVVSPSARPPRPARDLRRASGRCSSPRPGAADLAIAPSIDARTRRPAANSLPRSQRRRGERDISRKLRLEPMAEMGSGGAHGKALRPARNARSSAVAGCDAGRARDAPPHAPGRAAATVDHIRSSARRHGAGRAPHVVGRDRGECARTAWRRAPRAWLFSSSTRNAPMVPSAMPARSHTRLGLVAR